MRATRGFQLVLLTVAEAGVAYARTALGPLQETMRTALAFSDNQMALIQGPALALPMALAAVPLGLAIDRYSRSRLLLLLAALTVIGNLMTALAPNFALLFVARSLIGFTAPVTAVAICSLIADLYAPDQRGRATMVMAIGGVGGMSASFALGGVLVTMFASSSDAWRSAMSWLTVPLVPLIFLMLALREPARTGVAVRNPSLREARAELWRYRAVIVPLLAGQLMVGVADGAALIWSAPALARGFSLSADRVGAIMATVLLVSGIVGPISGGVLADLCQRSGGPRRTALMLGGVALLSALAGVFALMPALAFASVLLGTFMTVGSAVAVAGAALATVTIPNELRGLFMSATAAAGAIFGFGLAPVMVSLLSGAIGGSAMIRTALAATCVTTSLLGAATFALGSRHFPRIADEIDEQITAGT